MRRLSTQAIPEYIEPKACTHSPNSFESGKYQRPEANFNQILMTKMAILTVNWQPLLRTGSNRRLASERVPIFFTFEIAVADDFYKSTKFALFSELLVNKRTNCHLCNTSRSIDPMQK